MQASTAALAILVLMAGCLGNGTEVATTAPSDNRSAPPAPGPADGPDDREPDTTPRAVSLYLTPEMRLTTDPPPDGEPQRVALAPFTEGLALGFEGISFWGSDGPSNGAVTVTRATTTYYWTRDAPGVAQPEFPQFGAVLGAADATHVLAFSPGPATVMADEVHEVTLELALPMGGLVFLQHQPAQFLPFGLYHPSTSAAGHDAVLVGSSQTPSRLDLVVENVTLPPVQEVEVLRERVHVEGDGCDELDAGNPRAVLPFDVPADAAGLRVVATRTGGQGQEDIDLNVLGPGGQVVASGRTPFSTEVVDLWVPNLDAAGRGTWTADAYSCAAQSADIEVVVVLRVPIDAR